MTTPQVKIVDYSGQQIECPAEIANYVASRSPRGLVVHECECQAHCWALPWDDAMERWVSHQISPIRSMLEEKGYKPEKPAQSQHVILISHEDAHLLTTRRWRVFRTTNGRRVRWVVQSGPRGLGLHRFIHPSAECVAMENGNGLDLRRENLRRTTLRQILKERNKRLGWGKKAKKAA
jgi:hypothetical protein